ncbi:MAG: hypothetical protein JXB48_09410 [Candidatus Latescibacteria bacterium]|nr:hypothetical protein [Candidatus Latescibacterota bacterium]
MPGLSLIAVPKPDTSNLDTVMRDMKHGNHIQVNTLYRDDTVMILFSGYGKYPVWSSKHEGIIIAMEGMIYDAPESLVQEKIEKIAHDFKAGMDVTDLIRDFINNSDGDFLVVIYSKESRSVLLFNDKYGRLPCLYYEDDSRLIVSREPTFLLNYVPSLEIDRLGLAEFFTWEFTLGSRTLFKNIHRLPESHAIIGSVFSGENRVKVWHHTILSLQFDTKTKDQGRHYYLERAHELYMHALQNRYTVCGNRGLILTCDVSGGCDTRSVLIGLESIGADVNYYTHDLITGNESNVAKNITDAYGKKLNIVSTSHEIDYDEMAGLLYRTGCMVNGITTLVCWRDEQKRREMVGGSSACFMGFAGERLRAFVLPHIGHKTAYSMFCRHLLRNRMSPQSASILAGIPYEMYDNEAKKHFGEYRETTIDGHIRHFFYELVRNYADQGENRARNFYWTIPPHANIYLCDFEINELPLKYLSVEFFVDFIKMFGTKGLEIPLYKKGTRLNSKTSVKIADLQKKTRFAVKNAIMNNDWSQNIFYKLKAGRQKSHEFEKLAEKLMKFHDGLTIMKPYFQNENLGNYLAGASDISGINRVISVLLFFRELEKRHPGKLVVN